MFFRAAFEYLLSLNPKKVVHQLAEKKRCESESLIPSDCLIIAVRNGPKQIDSLINLKKKKMLPGSPIEKLGFHKSWPAHCS